MLYDVFYRSIEGFKFPKAENILRLRSLGLVKVPDVDWQYANIAPAVELLGLPAEWISSRLRDSWGGGAHSWSFELELSKYAETVDSLKGRGVPEDVVMRLYHDGSILGKECEEAGGLVFPRAQFSCCAEGMEVFYPELFECSEILARSGVPVAEAVSFLFDPKDDYGFLTPAELLMSGDKDLRTLVIADVYAHILAWHTDSSVRRWRATSVGNVPNPGIVRALAGTGFDADALVAETAGGGFDDLAFEEVAKALHMQESVLLSRAKDTGRKASGWDLRWVSERTVARRLGLSIGEVRGMGDRGELLVMNVVDGEYEFARCNFSPVLDGADGFVDAWLICPAATRLIQELSALSWAPEKVVRFLETPSAWFGMVRPIEYGRLGDEYVDAVVAVAQLMR